MNSVTDHLSELVSQTSNILGELKSESFSLEELASKMDLRDGTIHQLDTLKDDLNASMVSDEDREKISSLFNKFERLNIKIDNALKDALRESRETLAAASNKRKADDKYHVLTKPDITHF